MLSCIRNDRFDVENFENGEYMIIANVFDKKLRKHWSLVNVYGPAQDEFKDRFLSKLSNFCFKVKYPVLMSGDFNILRYSIEKNKKFNENN
jgi:exonuclease III